jgi:hypothetical protein
MDRGTAKLTRSLQGDGGWSINAGVGIPIILTRGAYGCTETRNPSLQSFPTGSVPKAGWRFKPFNGFRRRKESYMRSQRIVCIGCCMLFFSFTQVALAQDFIVFPSRGQSQAQMERDKVECQIWARQQTGFDPLQTPVASTPPPSAGAPQGGLIRGGARGAAVGVVGGAIAGDAGRGAAIGAGTGALIGGMRRSDQLRQENEAQRQWTQQEAAAHASARDRFNRAYRTCLEGKGYAVN